MADIYCVHVISNPESRYYIGLSENVATRLDQHNTGVSKWTRGKGPWILVWTSEPMSLSNARKFENRLKRQGRGAGFYRLTGLPRLSGS